MAGQKKKTGNKKGRKQADRAVRSWKSKLLLSALALVLISSLALAIYAGLQARTIDARFGGRRWSVPSRVYSDVTLLYPG